MSRGIPNYCPQRADYMLPDNDKKRNQLVLIAFLDS